MAAVQYFLKIDGVNGESSDAKHRGEIDVLSWSFGEQRQGNSGSGAGGAVGRAEFQDFQFIANTSKASPQLFLACASGEHLNTAVLTCRREAGFQLEFLVIKFSDLLVSGYQGEGPVDKDVVPLDRVSLNFAKIEVSYVERKADGTLAPPINLGWDIKSGTRI
jgi:type VI secretion system secreted protein Hcp